MQRKINWQFLSCSFRAWYAPVQYIWLFYKEKICQSSQRTSCQAKHLIIIIQWLLASTGPLYRIINYAVFFQKSLYLNTCNLVFILESIYWRHAVSGQSPAQKLQMSELESNIVMKKNYYIFLYSITSWLVKNCDTSSVALIAFNLWIYFG